MHGGVGRSNGAAFAATGGTVARAGSNHPDLRLLYGVFPELGPDATSNETWSIEAVDLAEFPVDPASLTTASLTAESRRARIGTSLAWAPAQATLGRPLPDAEAVVRHWNDWLPWMVFPSSSPVALEISRGDSTRRFVAVWTAPVQRELGQALGAVVDPWSGSGLPRLRTMVEGPFAGRVLLGVIGIGGCRHAITWLACERDPETQTERWTQRERLAAPCLR